MHQILAINPGSTSTKFAVYNDTECVFTKTIRHPLEQLLRYKNIIDQFAFRKGLIIEALVEEGIEVDAIKYIIGRGGLTYPLESGVYKVNNLMLEHLREGIMGHHASNLGGLLADYIALQIPNAQAFIADPVVTDELDEVARFAGHPRFKRQSIFHALNQKATARLHAQKVGKKYEDLRLIVAHLGGGISVGVHKNGRVIDVNNALDGEGAFSPERSGTLPVGQVIDLCFSGEFSQEQLRRMVVGEGGFVAYMGTNDAQEVEKLSEKGDEKAIAVQEALFYQVAKMIGEMAVVLDGKVDGILLTGGLAYSKQLEAYIQKKTGFISELFVYPGEDELQALASNALRVAKGEIEAREYNPFSK
ncbi:butyrate kinase [Draconibacterium sp. IB214405]|uniref:butyrate kinase n=1 Tax=Draconibacterium sp. IB214405 TaxID=3097352 RepID=UPI002A16B773|nr:butyrate kinase [Draconibacterium sp. IB214405]MDX8340060.1 butyrate kinase [Draconibacterium sp. IB214405]